MKFKETNPPREFKVGDGSIQLKDTGRIELDPDEQITLLTDKGAEYDVVRKEWGFYATPSLNGRLISFDLRTVLVKNKSFNRYYILLVEKDKRDQIDDYLTKNDMKVIMWLDNDENLQFLEDCLNKQ